MKNLFANPIVARILGALGAGVATYGVTHDLKGAAVTAATFVIYGGVHATTQATAADQPNG